MKKSTFTFISKAFSLALVASLFSFQSNAQFLMSEDFNYADGSMMAANGWNAHSGVGTRPISVTPGALTYTGYIASGIGKTVLMDTTGEDISKNFSEITAGSIYVATIVNVQTAGNGGEYFLHLGPTTMGTTYRMRVYCKNDSLTPGKFSFGIAKSSTAGQIVYSAATYNYNTAYMLVAKYKVIAGADNDSVFLFINPTISSTEPSATLTQFDAAAGSDMANVGTIALRQGTFPNGPRLRLGSLRVSQSWSNAVTGNVGTSQVSSSNLLKVYPNPSNGVLNVNYTGSEMYTVSLTNIAGQNVVSKRSQGYSSLSTEGLSAGIYILKLETEGNVYFEKVSVK